MELTESQIARFWDAQRGGFYDTAGDDPSLLVRTKEQYDGAEPAGNSTAAMNLLRLGALTGDQRYRERAEETIRSFSAWLTKQPSIMPYMASAVLRLLETPSQIVILGKRNDVSTGELWREYDKRFLPNMVRIPVDPQEQNHLAGLIPYAGQVQRSGGSVTAYVCSNFACRLPVGDPIALGNMLDEL
jgi:uncharacterized protein YyaL (SSP411 family)